MKKGWTYKKLGEVVTFMSGYTPKKDELTSSGSYPYFKVAEMNMNGNEKYMRRTSLFVSSPKKFFPSGSIIFPKNGGAIFTEKKRLLEKDSVIDLNTEAVIANDGMYNMFLFYYLSYIKISSFDKGGGLPSLDLKKMSESIISFPSLSEQQGIVERLDSAFEHIDALKANAEKQLSEARVLFQKALERAMTPKKGWVERTFGEVSTYHKEQDRFKNMKYLGMEHMESGTGKIIGYINSNDVQSNSFRFYKGEVLYGRLRPYLKKVYVAEFDGCCSTEVFPIKSEVIESDFIKYWFLTDTITDKINKTSAGCRMPRGNMNEVRSFLIAYPEKKSDQHRIVARLDTLTENIKALEENQRKIVAECDAMKQAILRKVFE